MPSPAFMPPAAFAAVIRNTPLVAIDLILRDPEGAVLVGLRTNEPAKGFWFVPGGRIRKNERLDAAFARILKQETGLEAPRAEAKRLGVYEHLYETNVFEDPSFDTHYVVIGYELRLESRPAVQTDQQHSAIRWLSVDALLKDGLVHDNTKAYFR